MSAYARQFLGGSEKPLVDSIDGLSPAISIDQKTKYVGRVLKHDLEAGRLLQESDLEP